MEKKALGGYLYYLDNGRQAENNVVGYAWTGRTYYQMTSVGIRLPT